jgi:hypothetical protein
VVLTYDHHAWQELKLNGCAVRLERAPPKSEAAHSASQVATRNEPPGRSPADSREREKEREREREKEKARDVERREREKEREKEQKEREKTERARDVERRETEKVREKEQKEREQREREQRERERDRQQRPGAFPVPPGDRREPLQAERERFSVGDAGARPHSANVGSVPFSSDSRGVQGPGPAVDATPKMCGVGMVLEPPDPGQGNAAMYMKSKVEGLWTCSQCGCGLATFSSASTLFHVLGKVEMKSNGTCLGLQGAQSHWCSHAHEARSSAWFASEGALPRIFQVNAACRTSPPTKKI